MAVSWKLQVLPPPFFMRKSWKKEWMCEKSGVWLPSRIRVKERKMLLSHSDFPQLKTKKRSWLWGLDFWQTSSLSRLECYSRLEDSVRGKGEASRIPCRTVKSAPARGGHPIPRWADLTTCEVWPSATSRRGATAWERVLLGVTFYSDGLPDEAILFSLVMSPGPLFHRAWLFWTHTFKLLN